VSRARPPLERRVQSASSIKSLLESRGLRPNRSLGQNFLVEPAHIRRLIDASGAGGGDAVLEVGPGTGALTDELLARGCEVVACELDAGLAALLRERFAPASASGAFVLMHGDCLEGKRGLNREVIGALRGRPFRLVANLPYNAASPLMIELATAHHPARAAGRGLPPCLGQFVTIQREVADRLRAAPGTRDYSEMSVMVQAMAQVRRIAVLPPGCFWPPPKVESEMVSILPRAEPASCDPARLSRLCRLLFTQRRKQIGTILSRAGLDDALTLPSGVQPTMRPEALDIGQLVELSRRMPDAQAEDEPGRA
jgi:16S rRNA (adenine1518-N6/adenine1519-N6)-dimethyltransferase